MNFLQKFDDIAVPNKNVDCIDNELIHPLRVQDYFARYSQLSGQPVRAPDELIECFYRYNAGARYAGFKTFPIRHRNFEAFTARTDIQFITLTRADIASTAASYLTARRAGSWHRAAGTLPEDWTFDDVKHGPELRHYVAYLAHSYSQLARVPGAIHLTYERLCEQDFRSQALDEFFGRPVRLDAPHAPSSGTSYVGNWDQLVRLIAAEVLKSQFPSASTSTTAQPRRMDPTVSC
jgi:hypothetical protein